MLNGQLVIMYTSKKIVNYLMKIIGSFNLNSEYENN